MSPGPLAHLRLLIRFTLLLLPTTVLAETVYTPTNASGQVEIILKDHRFTPAEIHIPAGKRTQLLVKNQDRTSDEFNSTALKVEKVIAGGRESVVRLQSLDAGRYPFIGEFNPETAQGVVIAE